MKKQFNSGEEFTLPITKSTPIRVEGLGDYGIVDVLTYCGNFNYVTYALLEHWTRGEDDMCVVKLTGCLPLWIIREGGKKFYDKYDRKFFLPRGKIIIESACNSLDCELIDYCAIEFDELVKWWSDEEIDQ